MAAGPTPNWPVTICGDNGVGLVPNNPKWPLHPEYEWIRAWLHQYLHVHDALQSTGPALPCRSRRARPNGQGCLRSHVPGQQPPATGSPRPCWSHAPEPIQQTQLCTLQQTKVRPYFNHNITLLCSFNNFFLNYILIVLLFFMIYFLVCFKLCYLNYHNLLGLGVSSGCSWQ